MLLSRAFKALQIWPHFSYPIIAASIPLQELPAPISEVSMPFSTRSRFILPSCLCSCCSPHLPTPPPFQECPPSSIRSQANPSSKAQLKSRLVRVPGSQGPYLLLKERRVVLSTWRLRLQARALSFGASCPPGRTLCPLLIHT